MDPLIIFSCCPHLWVVWLFVSWLGGAIVVFAFTEIFGRYMRVKNRNEFVSGTKGFPPVVTGIIERTIFTIWIGAAGPSSAVVTGMGGWLALKLASNWHRRSLGDHELVTIRKGWLGFMAGVLSLGIAFICGAIIWQGVFAATRQTC